MRLIFWLPDSVTMAFGSGVGRFLFFISAKRRNIILTNLSIAFPEKSDGERLALAKRASRAGGQLIAEFPKAWFGDKELIDRQIIKVVGSNLLEEYSRHHQPVIIVTPHIGNWEFFVQWLQIHFTFFGLYTSSRLPQVDRLILEARSKFGAAPFPANSKGVLNILRKLKKGGIMAMLPDQVPQKGGGIYSPFFGQSAYTMTLLHKMIQKTNAKLLFAYCVRREGKGGFDLIIEQPLFDDQEQDIELFNAELNQHIEKIIRLYPEQYVWDYKRFKSQPDGINLYKNNLYKK